MLASWCLLQSPSIPQFPDLGICYLLWWEHFYLRYPYCLFLYLHQTPAHATFWESLLLHKIANRLSNCLQDSLLPSVCFISPIAHVTYRTCHIFILLLFYCPTPPTFKTSYKASILLFLTIIEPLCILVSSS